MDNYKKYLKSKNLKNSTIKNYLWHVRQFLHWLNNKKATASELKNYFKYLLKKYQKINTINLRLKIINNYLHFIHQQFQFDLLSDHNLELKILDNEILNQFLENPLKKNSHLALRDKALLELLYHSGLKVGRLIEVKKQQVDDIRQELFLSKNNSIYLSPHVWMHLKKYLDSRHDDIDYLFINFDRSNKSKNKSLSVRSVERIISQYSKNIKPAVNINPQILRNTLAYQLKSTGAQSEHIKAALHFQTRAGAKNYLKKI
ncbi:MAG: hypothetical protein A2406_03005 [Candidatus Komeilibacteria bacterium RIFOXYC1_FULL_37_11]|uniref:Integrase n=1 Tax=Candidatus Komeilibacteria bacterium RIFOXYC1_FULL_37_11 TaxID=1798555 RepID=A0A1G2BYZ4_9BACT|nr:MAG: hypothetical protein A2406_03005 [Candidatus Komeilibacteria bacterium RIFOXYC1_FULL_37_11]OGY95703.1 MAG: hypothetical protein A2611_02890 [Candidatus Komeilibacteria bacterium RIFOXYD1_FULL_37_29]